MTIKRKIKLIFIVSLIVMISFTCGCTNKKVVEKKETPKKVVVKKEKPFVDDNPILIGLYINRNLVTTYKDNLTGYKDIGVFSAVASNDVSLNKNGYFRTMWQEYWNKYTNIENYKIGYAVKFTLTTGETIEKTILSPKDIPSFEPYLMAYLYDDIHQTPGVRYSHVTEEQVKPETIFTSIKVQSSYDIAKVVSPFTLTVFTYDNADNFNAKTGKYIGRSSYTITIDRY